MYLCSIFKCFGRFFGRVLGEFRGVGESRLRTGVWLGISLGKREERKGLYSLGKDFSESDLRFIAKFSGFFKKYVGN